MRSFLGSALVILAGGMTGLSLYSELVKSLRRVAAMQSVLEVFRTETCIRLRPLPEAAARALEGFPGKSGCGEKMAARIRDETFSALWAEEICGAKLPAEGERCLLRLGEALSEGEPAERAFGACELTLSRVADRLRRKAEASRSLYLAVGFSSGCMLSLLLL